MLIEGPSDADELLPLVARREHASRPSRCSGTSTKDPAQSVFYPFAVFSPEWQAIRWALARRADRAVHRPPGRRGAGERVAGRRRARARRRPAAAARRGRRLRGPRALVGGHGRAPATASRRVRGGDRGDGGAARAARRGRDRPRASSAARRTCARTSRAARDEGFERIAVVCGAWHAPVFGELDSAPPLKARAGRQDDADLGAVDVRPARRCAAATAPACARPGWYEHLFQADERPLIRWLSRVGAHAARPRRRHLDRAHHRQPPAPPRRSPRCAAGRSPGCRRSTTRCEATLGEGAATLLALIEEQLIIGERLGRVSPDVPTVPLQRDLEAQQRSLRLKPEAAHPRARASTCARTSTCAAAICCTGWRCSASRGASRTGSPARAARSARRGGCSGSPSSRSGSSRRPAGGRASRSPPPATCRTARRARPTASRSSPGCSTAACSPICPTPSASCSRTSRPTRRSPRDIPALMERPAGARARRPLRQRPPHRRAGGHGRARASSSPASASACRPRPPSTTRPPPRCSCTWTPSTVRSARSPTPSCSAPGAPRWSGSWTAHDAHRLLGGRSRADAARRRILDAERRRARGCTARCRRASAAAGRRARGWRASCPAAGLALIHDAHAARRSSTGGSPAPPRTRSRPSLPILRRTFAVVRARRSGGRSASGSAAAPSSPRAAVDVADLDPERAALVSRSSGSCSGWTSERRRGTAAPLAARARRRRRRRHRLRPDRRRAPGWTARSPRSTAATVERGTHGPGSAARPRTSRAGSATSARTSRPPSCR